MLADDRRILDQLAECDQQNRIQPANDEYQPIILDAKAQQEKNVSIIGKVLHNRIKFS